MGNEVFTYRSNPEALKVIEIIVAPSGLEPNFVILAADVPNAAATIDPETGDRLILYNPAFLRQISLERPNRLVCDKHPCS